MAEIFVVNLNEEERALFDSICWDLTELSRKGDGERFGHFDRVAALAKSLLARQALPEVRVAYFTDPAMNVGGRGKSHKEQFELNDTSGEALLRHHDFMAYLRYFILGPDLPAATIEGFCKIIEDDRGTSGMVLGQIQAFVRKEVRDRGLNRGDAAEEFFKLAHEIGKPSLASPAHSAAKQVRK